MEANSSIVVAFDRIKEKVSVRNEREERGERKGKEREKKGKSADRKIPKECEISEAISRLRIGARPFSLSVRRLRSRTWNKALNFRNFNFRLFVSVLP